MSEVQVKIRDNGPLLVEGSFKLLDAAGLTNLSYQPIRQHSISVVVARQRASRFAMVGRRGWIRARFAARTKLSAYIAFCQCPQFGQSSRCRFSPTSWPSNPPQPVGMMPGGSERSWRRPF